MLCTACKPGEAILDIPLADSTVNMGQIQKLGFQRRKNGLVANSFVMAEADPELLASWTPLKTAADDTKIQFTPYIAEPSSEAGEARLYGGGNATPGGIEIVLGRNPSPFTAQLLRTPPKVAKALKAYECETLLNVFLVTECGLIWGIVDDLDNPTTFSGIPIRGFFVGDRVPGGYDNVDKNAIQFKFEANWSDNLYGVTPTDFDALTALS